MTIWFLAVLICFLQLAQRTESREKPELTFGVNVNKIGVGTRFRECLGILEPTVKWTHGGRVLGCDYAAGVDVKEEYGEKGLRYTVFARIKRSLLGWNLKARLDTANVDFLGSIDTYAHAELDKTKTMMIVQGLVHTHPQKDENVDRLMQMATFTALGLEQPFANGNGMLDMRYLLDGNRNLKFDLSFRNDETKTVLNVGGDRHRQRFTIAQKILKSHEIAPTISSDGKFASLRYRKNVGNGQWTGLYTPRNSLMLQFVEWPLSIALEIPMQGYYNLQRGARLTLKRSLPSFA